MIGHLKLDRQLGITVQKLGQCRRDIAPSEHNRNIDPQCAAGFILQLGNGGIRLIDVRDNSLGMPAIDLTGLGQVQLAGSAVEQARPELVFQPADLARNR